MIKNITKYIKEKASVLVPAAAFLLPMTMVSCQDFFDVDSNHIIKAEDATLSTSADTIYSMIGVLNKLQAIGDRTIIFGEARGDLVNVTDAANADLRSVALFNVSDSNKYNSPRDYYAIINQCNLYIAKADTALQDSHGNSLFLKEYAAIKAIRAWTYLQLVTTYGKVPFVTTPILTKEESEQDYPMKDIKEVCEYFINEDGLMDLAANDAVSEPAYGTIKGTPSQLFYIPLYVILGDLNLWADHYLDAAKCYYKYLDTRTTNKGYPLTNNMEGWSGIGVANYTHTWSNNCFTESTSSDAEVISVIPMDSVASEGYYSELRGIFNSTYADDYKVSLTPSQNLIDLSNSQQYIYYDKETEMFVPLSGSGDYNKGDLRLNAVLTLQKDGYTNNEGEKIDIQQISKTLTHFGNIHIYRRAIVYLRLAEALNRAGYPVFAYYLLAAGVDNSNLKSGIAPYYRNDSTMLVENFPFPTSRYWTYYPNDNTNTNYKDLYTIGLHTRGSGWAAFYPGAYSCPYNYSITDSLKQTYWMEKQIEDMIVNEEALECAFEGYRYYDLLRVALRRYNGDPTYPEAGDNQYLSNKIKARGGAAVTVDLTDKKNWFLHYKDEIGY